MVSAVLAGPDGKSPAIEAGTGTPLTIEELLKRRGFVAAGGNVHLPGVADPSGDAAPGTAVAAALAARGAPNAAAGAVTGPNNTQPSNTVDPATGQPVAAVPVADPATSGMDTSGLGTAAAVAGTGAAGYALYKALRNRKPRAAGPNAGSFGVPGPAPKAGQQAGGAVEKADTGVMSVMRNRAQRQRMLAGPSGSVAAVDGSIPYGEYTDVTARPGSATRMHGAIEGTRQLSAPIPDGDYTEILPSIRRALSNRTTRRALSTVVR